MNLSLPAFQSEPAYTHAADLAPESSSDTEREQDRADALSRFIDAARQAGAL